MALSVKHIFFLSEDNDEASNPENYNLTNPITFINDSYKAVSYTHLFAGKEGLYYTVTHDGRTVIDTSALGITIDDTELFLSLIHIFGGGWPN